MPDPSRSEFGNFLRSRRAKLNPKLVGLPDGRRRRAPGLRREEVAELAGIGVDWYIRLEQGRAVSPSVTTIDAQPAYITGRRWDVLAWNKAAADIFGFDRLAEEDCNILICVLLYPGSRRLFGSSWAEEAKRIVAQFRATHDLWAGDPAFVALLTRLRDGSPEFAEWWEAHDIRAGAGGVKRLRHPKKGLLRFAHASFQANDDPDLKLIIYSPA